MLGVILINGNLSGTAVAVEIVDVRINPFVSKGLNKL